MLKELRALWTNDSLMGDVISRLGQMVADANYVYTHAWEACVGQAVAAELKDEIRDHDKGVNRAEREVRRMIVEHLTINPRQDISGCLAVMIIAKDLERLGDHCRNIFNLAEDIETPLSEYRHFQQLQDIQRSVGEQFAPLQRGIEDSSEEIAHEILAAYQDLKEPLKTLRAEVLDAQGLTPREAIITSLMGRYLMRINAHIGNAASGIIFPLENIDFVSRGLKQEQDG